eukprot:6538251-Pyramimonas_sp.AAC.1
MEGKYRSSVDAREPQNPPKSEEYRNPTKRRILGTPMEGAGRPQKVPERLLGLDMDIRFRNKSAGELNPLESDEMA